MMTIRELYVLTNGEGTQRAALSFIGSHFRCLFGEYLTTECSDDQCGSFVIRRYILTHLEDPLQKLEFLAYMTRKLLHFMTDCLVEDDPDSLANQEVLMPGQLWLLFLQEKLQDAILAVREEILRQLSANVSRGELMNPDFIRGCILRARGGIKVGDRMQHMISTGNASLRDGSDLLQKTGFSVVADRVNFQRFLAHFYCVHRGQYFMDLRSSEFRKLKPETWGFICPVHTPDGAPCGILNHLSQSCRVVADYLRAMQERRSLEQFLQTLPLEFSLAHGGLYNSSSSNAIPLLVDGCFWGYVRDLNALTEMLRRHKLRHGMRAEIVPVYGLRLFPSLLLFSTPSRLVRPVWNRLHRCEEWIGSMEQLFLTIDLQSSIFNAKTARLANHCELNTTNILSLLASFIPFSHMNQSPRNIYQCQMGKQAMGVPFHDIERRFDTKSYRLSTPQQPLVQNRSESQAGWSKVYGTSFNAVVAVISYTGYDMEDGMVINRSSLDRGLAHGTIYSSERIDLDQMAVEKDATFSKLPAVGDRLSAGSVLYAVRGRRPHIYRSSEIAYIDAVVLAENQRRVTIRTRVPRRPVIGDKFASRHGQKGVLSAIWPAEDMPYSADGIVPDILFNPNGFPSRMTIGMMIECIAGKVAAVHGQFPIDATSFMSTNKDEPLHDVFGRLLCAAGYAYHGTETMYSGYTGEPFQVQIFVGIISWQRLRHHIADKFQVRTEGIIHQTLRQPLRGRKRGGAIRLGEMERDALLASGAAYTLQDRLQNCSDLHTVHVSVEDGSLLSPVAVPNLRLGGTREVTIQSCTFARSPVVRVHMPYAFKYLIYELAAMNIRVSVHVR
jgi:DNA-directed RNA polymerase I subunit RPA2